METEGLEPYQELISEILADDSVDPLELCASLAKMVNGNEPLFLDTTEEEPEQKEISDDERGSGNRREKRPTSAKAEMLRDFPEIEMKRYMVDVHAAVHHLIVHGASCRFCLKDLSEKELLR